MVPCLAQPVDEGPVFLPDDLYLEEERGLEHCSEGEGCITRVLWVACHYQQRPGPQLKQ